VNIRSLTIRDFGPVVEDRIEFDQPLSIIGGDNAQGKTTIANALRLTFTPRCPNTDKKGAGAMDNIRLGAKKAEIVAGVGTAKGPLQIKTTYGPGASRRNQTIVAGQGDDAAKYAAGFGSYLDRQTEALSCCLDSDYFFNPKTEQKDILAAMIIAQSHTFEADKVALAETHLGKFVWDKSPVAVIDQAYAAAYSARKDAKAALGGIYIQPQPQRPEYAAGHVQEQIAAFRALATKEAKKIKGGGTVQLGRIEQQLEQEKEKLAQARIAYSAAIKRRGEIDQAMLDGPNVKKAERTAAGRKLWDQLAAQIAGFVQEIEGQQEAQNIYQELLQDENGSPVDHANCPTCTQAVTRKLVNGKIDELQKLIVAAEQAKQNLVAEQAALGNVAEAEKIVADNAAWTEKKLQVTKDVTAATGSISAFEKSIEALEASLTTAKAQESEPADTTALDAANAELATWEARLSPALNYDSTLAQIEQATKRQQDQKAKVADLETLCAYFGDNGVKADLIAQGSEKFISTINSVLSKWGYEAKLSPEADAFTVLTPKGWLPTKQLSGFEELMFKAALQCAIAVHSKIKMVIVDEAQTMIDEQRVRLFKAIQGMLDEKLLDCAFVILADKRETAPSKPGVAYYRVQDGKVQRL
jgi:DNA repair exonuclease SbcCD ATPase subunit